MCAHHYPVKKCSTCKKWIFCELFYSHIIWRKMYIKYRIFVIRRDSWKKMKHKLSLFSQSSIISFFINVKKCIYIFVDFFKYFETVKNATRYYDPYMTRAKKLYDLQGLIHVIPQYRVRISTRVCARMLKKKGARIHALH